MSYAPSHRNTVSAGNSSTAAIAAGASFTGSAVDAAGYSRLRVFAYVDGGDAGVAAQVQVQFDSVSSFTSGVLTVGGTSARPANAHSQTFRVEARYARVVVTNPGASEMSTVKIQTILEATGGEGDGAQAGAGGNEAAVEARRGRGDVAAFGESLTATKEEVVSLQFPYRIDLAVAQVTSVSTGLASVDMARAKIATGTGSTGSCTLRSRVYAHYRPGQGIDVLWTAVYPTAGASGVTMLSGYGNGSDGLYFGYNGAAFGILHRTSTSGSVVDTWYSQAAWNVDSLDGTGASGMTLDPSKGNVYRITMQWLGYGEISFWAEVPEAGRPQVVHRLRYANTSTFTSIRRPSLPFTIEATKTSGATDYSVLCPSAGVYLQGGGPAHPPAFGTSCTLATSATVGGFDRETPVISLLCPTTVSVLGEDITTHSTFDLRKLTADSDSGSTLIVRLYKNLGAHVVSGAGWLPVNSALGIAERRIYAAGDTATTHRINGGANYLTHVNSTETDLPASHEDGTVSTTDDVYNGMYLLITGGTGAGQIREVTDYVGSSRRVTVGSAWTTNPDGTSEWKLIAAETGDIQGNAGNELVSATATTAVLPALYDTGVVSEADDAYEGWFLELIDGTGAPQTREVVSYTGSTRTLTVSTWETTPDNTTTWHLHQGQEIVSQRVNKNGGRVVDLAGLSLSLNPGETLDVTVEATTAGKACDIHVGLSWREFH